MHDDPIRIDPPLYLAHTRMSCWRCGADMPAIALVAPNVAETEGEICLLSEVEELPESVLQFVRKRFPSFKLTYSKTLGLRYYANTCPRCGVIFGDFYLHSEPGAPFFPTTEDEAKIELIGKERRPRIGPRAPEEDEVVVRLEIFDTQSARGMHLELLGQALAQCSDVHGDRGVDRSWIRPA